MKTKNARTLFKVIFGLVLLFAIYLLVFYNLQLGEESAKFWVSQHDWVVKFITNITANYIIYVIILGVLVAGYYFLVYRPKLPASRRRR